MSKNLKGRGTGKSRHDQGAPAPSEPTAGVMVQGIALPERRDYSLAVRAHRLAVQDVALSRRKQGFDSPWARHFL